MTNNNELWLPSLKMIYNGFERLQFYVFICPEGLLKLVTIHWKFDLVFHLIADFYKGHLPVNVLTGLFLLF